MRINQYGKFLGVLIPAIVTTATSVAANGGSVSHGTTPYTIGGWVIACILVYVVPNARSLAEQAAQVFTEVHHHHYLDAASSAVRAVGADVTAEEAATGRHNAKADAFAEGAEAGAALLAKVTAEHDAVRIAGDGVRAADQAVSTATSILGL